MKKVYAQVCRIPALHNDSQTYVATKDMLEDLREVAPGLTPRVDEVLRQHLGLSPGNYHLEKIYTRGEGFSEDCIYVNNYPTIYNKINALLKSEEEVPVLPDIAYVDPNDPLWENGDSREFTVEFKREAYLEITVEAKTVEDAISLAEERLSEDEEIDGLWGADGEVSGVNGVAISDVEVSPRCRYYYVNIKEEFGSMETSGDLLVTCDKELSEEAVEKVVQDFRGGEWDSCLGKWDTGESYVSLDYNYEIPEKDFEVLSRYLAVVRAD